MAWIVGYSRVSKKEQSVNSHALEQQTARLRSAGATEIYTDIQSGTRDDRRQFNALMQMVKDRLVTEVIVTRIDRLGRSLLSARKALDIFRTTGVKLTILDGEIDLSTVAGRTHANIMAVFAEMESEMISERSKHGWEYLRSLQVAMNPPFGYIKVGLRHELDRRPFLCLCDDRRELTIFELARDTIGIFFQQKSLRKTVQTFHQKYGIKKFNLAGPKTGFATSGVLQWCPSGLKNWLTNPVLRGHLSYLRDTPNPIQICDTHLEHRLLTDSEFREIDAILAHNRDCRGWGMKALKYPLSGLVVCADCGGACYSSVSGARNGKPRQYYYYQCKNYQHRACTGYKTIRMDKAEAALVEVLIERAAAITQLAQTPPEYVEPPELQQLRSQLAGLEALGHNPALELAKNDLRSQIGALVERSKTKNVVDEELQQLLLDSFSDPEYWNWDKLTSDHKRQIYRDLVKRVVVRDGQVEKVELKV